MGFSMILLHNLCQEFLICRDVLNLLLNCVVLEVLLKPRDAQGPHRLLQDRPPTD